MDNRTTYLSHFSILAIPFSMFFIQQSNVTERPRCDKHGRGEPNLIFFVHSNLVLTNYDRDATYFFSLFFQEIYVSMLAALLF